VVKTTSAPLVDTNTHIAVPASVANLGPGFDTLAVAVQLYLRVTIVEVKADGLGRVAALRSYPAMPVENGIERAYRSMGDRAGRPLPSVFVEVDSEIPIGSGLGSSAAATIAGLQLFDRCVAPLPGEVMLEAACALEGHPDNAAAALFGGLASAMQHEDGGVSVVGFDWPAGIRFVIATPERALRTAAARQVLPATLSRADAVFNLQRVARLLHAVTSGHTGSMREALKDRWHQPARCALVPELGPALALEDPNLLGVCLSGAGPSIVALASAGFDPISKKLEGLYRHSGCGVTVRNVGAEPRRAATPELVSKGR